MKSKHFVLASVLILAFMLTGYRYPVGTTTTLPSSVPAADHGCTSFCLDNGGQGVFGTNLDESFSEGYLYVNQRNVAKSAWEPNTAGEYVPWTSRYGSLTFNLVGYQLPWCGMNEAGLMISTMALAETRFPDADARIPLTGGYWIQYQLDNYSSVEEVIASDALVRIAPGSQSHYLACDASGDCATIELLEGKMVYHTGETLPVAALTNNIYADSIKVWQSGQSTYDNSLKRFSKAADRVTSFEATSGQGAVDYAFETLVQVKNPGLTAWSIVFDAQGRRAYFRTVRNEEIRAVDFSKLDFSCGKPVQMLSIDVKSLGDVSDDFVEYSHELSLAHLGKAVAYFGINLPQDAREMLLQAIEAYACAPNEEAVTQVVPTAQVEEAVTQVVPTVKGEEAVTPTVPPVNGEEAITPAAPRSFSPLGWVVAAALLVIVLLLILYAIRRKVKPS